MSPPVPTVPHSVTEFFACCRRRPRVSQHPPIAWEITEGAQPVHERVWRGNKVQGTGVATIMLSRSTAEYVIVITYSKRGITIEDLIRVRLWW